MSLSPLCFVSGLRWAARTRGRCFSYRLLSFSETHLLCEKHACNTQELALHSLPFRRDVVRLCVRREEGWHAALVDAFLPPRRTLQRRDLLDVLAPQIIRESLPLPDKANPKQGDNPTDAIRNGAARILRAYGISPPALFSLALPDIIAMSKAITPLEASDTDRLWLAVALRNQQEPKPSEVLLGGDDGDSVENKEPQFSPEGMDTMRRFLAGGKKHG